jgi:hypothetical protein
VLRHFAISFPSGEKKTPHRVEAVGIVVPEQHLLQDVSLIVKKNLSVVHGLDTIFVFPAHFGATRKRSMLTALDGRNVSMRACKKWGRAVQLPLSIRPRRAKWLRPIFAIYI